MTHTTMTNMLKIVLECTTNEDCFGTSDTCKSNVCYCGSKEKCAWRADMCIAGKCECGGNAECSSNQICSLSKCTGKKISKSKNVDN